MVVWNNNGSETNLFTYTDYIVSSDSVTAAPSNTPEGRSNPCVFTLGTKNDLEQIYTTAIELTLCAGCM